MAFGWSFCVFRVVVGVGRGVGPGMLPRQFQTGFGFVFEWFWCAFEMVLTGVAGGGLQLGPETVPENFWMVFEWLVLGGRDGSGDDFETVPHGFWGGFPMFWNAFGVVFCMILLCL